MHVIGRAAGGNGDEATGRLGRYLARDGSAGATVGVDLERPHAALVVGKRGAGKSHTLGVVADAPAEAGVRRAAANHLDAVASWGVFDDEGLTAASLLGGEATVLDLHGYDAAAMNAAVRATAAALYGACVDGDPPRLPWLLVDEAHAFVDGVAEPALRRLLTRGRAPGVSLVLATQRPAALPSVAVSQADLLVAHRLTSDPDVDALAAARPTYLAGDLHERLPSGTGEALVVDDATESVHTVRVRDRDTPHGGDSPRASDYGTETVE